MARSTKILAAALLAAFAARADPTTPETATTGEREQLLLEGELENGGYGGPRATYGRVAGHDAIYLGGEGGWILNHQYILGGAIQGLVSNQPAPGVFASGHDLTMLYGGGMIGYTLMPKRLVHVTFTTVVGGGGLGRKVRGTDSETGLGDSFFVVEPAATAEINVAKHFRWGLALSYRLVRGVDTDGLSNSDLSGLFGSMILKFGTF